MRVEFVRVRMPYIVLRGGWLNIIVLNVQSASEEKSDDSKDSFYEALGLSALLILQTFLYFILITFLLM